MQIVQQHLLPSQVEELRAIGVEFEDTMLYWCIGSNGYQNSSPTYRDVIEEAMSVPNPTTPNVGYNILPAPDLQKVLEKLPQNMTEDVNGEPREYLLSLWRTSKDWRIGYDDSGVAFFEGTPFVSHNPLLAAFKLLKMVATNHPKSLPKNK